MTKREWVGLIKEYLQRNDKENKYHPEVIIKTIEVVLKEMFTDLYNISPRSLGKYAKTYGGDTPIAIAIENSSGIYYSTLPVEVVNIPSKASGVIAIFPKLASTGHTFVPMTELEADMIYNTDVAVVTKKIGYRPRQDGRVEYYGMSGTVQAAGARMALLPVFSDYTDDEVVNIPELPTGGGTFLERVLTALSVIPPVDQLDNNKNTPITKGRE